MRFTKSSFFSKNRYRPKHKFLPYRQMLLWALLVGAGGGLIATLYYALLKGGLYVVWDVIQPQVQMMIPGSWSASISLLLVTVVGGLFVGMAAKWMKVPGEISAVVNNIHMRHGKMDRSKNASMTVSSLLSIIFGGSAGPEAPLVQLIGSGGSWLGEKLRLHKELIRTFTFCGMAAALGAFFGAPIGGALFALEIPHKRGLEYYESLIPSVVSAVTAFFVFRFLIGYHGVFYPMQELSHISIYTVLYGVGLGLLGAALAIIFIYLFKMIEKLLEPLQKKPIVLGGMGGAALGLLALCMPANFPVTVLFWSEYQIVDLINNITQIQIQYSMWVAVGLLLLMALLKMASVGFTLHSGYRGGFIFPLFFIGAIAGLALSFATGQFIPPTVAMLGIMAGINVGVTKTPISTTIILISMTGISLFPMVAAASIVSYLCTEKIRLIRSQQHRPDKQSPIQRVWRWQEH